MNHVKDVMLEPNPKMEFGESRRQKDYASDEIGDAHQASVI